jgi:hypothetical protein
MQASRDEGDSKLGCVFPSHHWPGGQAAQSPQESPGSSQRHCKGEVVDKNPLATDAQCYQRAHSCALGIDQTGKDRSDDEGSDPEEENGKEGRHPLVSIHIHLEQMDAGEPIRRGDRADDVGPQQGRYPVGHSALVRSRCQSQQHLIAELRPGGRRNAR